MDMLLASTKKKLSCFFRCF